MHITALGTKGAAWPAEGVVKVLPSEEHGCFSPDGQNAAGFAGRTQIIGSQALHVNGISFVNAGIDEVTGAIVIHKKTAIPVAGMGELHVRSGNFERTNRRIAGGNSVPAEPVF